MAEERANTCCRLWFHLPGKRLYNHLKSFKSFNIFCILDKEKLAKSNFPLRISSRNKNIFITSMGLIYLDLKETILHVYL